MGGFAIIEQSMQATNDQAYNCHVYDILVLLLQTRRVCM